MRGGNASLVASSEGSSSSAGNNSQDFFKGELFRVFDALRIRMKIPLPRNRDNQIDSTAATENMA
eukprot:CAMPEP_0116858198 /NCGR_PEP_ID=MMETSP0418-20121206/21023_1 /TAXON_ID=1158023 /ORGANISM="Astrosyne radiata, Strain 13vi08-1A" /LENGTH=64 /DNA_ID=CAMNT_0004492061 /DNA_START=1 /DNA_END=191 /DNA_ORIENTATION=+